MSPAPETCYCHSVKQLAAAAVQGVNLHPEEEAAPTPAVALNDDNALARIVGPSIRTSPLPDWADSFQTALNQEN